MIRYDKGWWGLKTFTKMYGSAFPKALPFSVGSAFLAGVLSYFFGKELDDAFIHPYPFQTFAFVAGFMVVFRSNLSYGRYWEGRTNLQLMTSKLTDAVVMALTFDREAVPKSNATEDQIKEHQWFRDTLIHLCSLLHAVALATLRTDYNMENIVAHDSLAHAPRANIRGVLEDRKLHPEEHMDVGSKINGVYSSSQTARSRKKRGRSNENNPEVRPAGNTGKLQLIDDDEHDPELQLPAVQKHSQHAYETAGLFSIMDYFYLPTGAEHAAKIYSIMKLPVVGGMTQAEGVALGAFVTSGTQCLAVPNLNLGIHGVLLENGMYAPAPTERVHTLLSWLQQLIIERIHAGGVKASPPIQARIHSTLTDCMLGYEQCKKLVDTPFPFPWAQAVNIVLLMFTIGAPVVIVAHTTSIFAAVLITFAAVQTHIMLNEVARDIEDPYHYDPNELPLPQMQYKLNERLIAVSHSRRPVAFTDVGELTGPGNTILLRDSPGPMRQMVAPPTSALAPPQRPTVPPAGLHKPIGAPYGHQGQVAHPRGDNSPARTTSLAQTASHATSASRGGARRGVGESVSMADMPSAGPGAVSAATLSSYSALDGAPGGGTGLSSSLTTGSRPVLNKADGDVTNMSSSSTPSMSFPPSQAAPLDAHPFAASSYLTSGLKSAGLPASEELGAQADEPLPPHPSQPTFSYGFAQNNVEDGSETSSLAQQANYLTSGEELAPDTASTVPCDRPAPTNKADLQQYSSTAPIPVAAQFHQERWGQGQRRGQRQAPSPRSAVGSIAPSTQGGAPPSSTCRPLSGELEGSESVWSSECPDQGNRMLHISGRADDKANGWPYNTRHW